MAAKPWCLLIEGVAYFEAVHGKTGLKPLGSSGGPGTSHHQTLALFDCIIYVHRPTRFGFSKRQSRLMRWPVECCYPRANHVRSQRSAAPARQVKYRLTPLFVVGDERSRAMWLSFGKWGLSRVDRPRGAPCLQLALVPDC